LCLRPKNAPLADLDPDVENRCLLPWTLLSAVVRSGGGPMGPRLQRAVLGRRAASVAEARLPVETDCDGNQNELASILPESIADAIGSWTFQAPISLDRRTSGCHSKA
jgi:hypothetical protein